MDKKIINVTLTNPVDGVGDITLEISHAERLLKMANNGGWKLPKDSLYKLTTDGLVKKSDNRNSQNAKK